MKYEKYRKEFDQYTQRFDLEDGRNQLKLLHTYKVCEVMERLTKALSLSEELSRLAYLSALFHDVARFEQVREYGTFNDALSFDHGDRGVEIIVKEGFLQDIDKKEQKKVLKAIETHNKYKVEAVEDEETLLLCKLIRDADKCDIFRVFACENMVDTMGETIEQVSKETITDLVMETILNHSCINKLDRKTGLDKWIGFLGFLYDMNYVESIQIAKEEGYYRQPFDKTAFVDKETSRRVKVILQDVESFLESQCNS